MEVKVIRLTTKYILHASAKASQVVYTKPLWFIRIKMTNQGIKSIIEEELKSKGYSNQSTVHGLDLDKCLVEPLKQIYLNSFNESQTFELWTVLEESEDGNGYKIAYDPDDNSFSLGLNTNKGELMYIGTYGTFLETLLSM